MKFFFKKSFSLFYVLALILVMSLPLNVFIPLAIAIVIVDTVVGQKYNEEG